MASSAPGTPNVKRSFSLPVARPTPTSPDQLEVLYTHPSVRIISFSTAAPGSRPSSRSGNEEEVTNLPDWSSRFERTIATGALRIYRAPGSVAFLNCVNALRPILPKSQCWCVDNESKFVLQVRPPEYWRIEVPNATAEELSRVEEFKKVLGHILRFEKTTCPFQRDFIVELPELPQTPMKKTPWKPIEKSRRDSSPLSTRRKESISMDVEFFGLDLNSSPTLYRRHSLAPVKSTLSIPDTLEELPTSTEGAQTISQPTVEELRTVYVHPHILRQESSKSLPLGNNDEVVGFIETPNTLAYGCVREEAYSEGDADQPPPLINNDDLGPQEEITLPLDTPPEESPLKDYPVMLADSDSFSDTTDETDATPRSQSQSRTQRPVFDVENNDQHSSLPNRTGSATTPPILSLITSTPEKETKKDLGSPLRHSPIAASGSELSSSVDSFHSVQSWHSPLAPPSPPASEPSSPTAYPYPHDNIIIPKKAHHSRDISEQTARPETPNVWDSAAISFEAKATSANTLSSSTRESKKKTKTPSPIETGSTIRHRATTSSNSRRRALSPMPPAVNLFSPRTPRPRRLQTARHLPTAILQKTCEILLSPPSHLFNIMMNIASRIAAGEWRGLVSGYGESIQWDFQEEYGREGLEDDYGISLPNPPKATRSRGDSGNSSSGGSWEVD